MRVGNAEFLASFVVDNDVDPLPAWYDPGSDGFLGEAGIDDLGSFVADLPTVFLKVASYRDELCHLTIADAFDKATHPERLFVGVVQQNGPGDVPCLHSDAVDLCPPGASPSTEAPTLCRWASHVRLFKQHAKDATGPTFARHVGDRLYRGEYFVLQTDAHMTFVTGWDEDVIGQYDAAQNDRAILTTYPTEVEGSLDADGHSLHRTSPVMCATAFTGEGLLRHGSAIEIYPMFGPKAPVLHPFWAAGFSFSRGHLTVRVPYDCCTPMMFQGEEIDVAARAWTAGYDMYTPHNSVAFHPYNRKSKPHMFWENTARHKGEGMRSAIRVQALIEMAPNPAALAGYDSTDAARYGLGTVRSVDDFYALFGLDREHRKVTKDLCRWSTSGQMHRQLVAFMRPDKKGIDYAKAFAVLGRDFAPNKGGLLVLKDR